MNYSFNKFGHHKISKVMKALLSAGCLAVLVAVSTSPAHATLNNAETVFTTYSDSTQVFEVVDQMPELEGGISSIYKHIKYPKGAIAGGIEGRVFVKFIVDKNGNVKEPRVIKDIGAGCGDAAVEGLKKVKFKPGMHQGEPVSVYYTLPITFEIKN